MVKKEKNAFIVNGQILPSFMSMPLLSKSLSVVYL